jgi:hypothetical protein
MKQIAIIMSRIIPPLAPPAKAATFDFSLVEEGVGGITSGWIDVDETGGIAIAAEQSIPEAAVIERHSVVAALEGTSRNVVREGFSAVAAVLGTAVRGDLPVVDAIGIVHETFVEGGRWAVTEGARAVDGTIMGDPSAISAAVAVVVADVRGFPSVTEVRVGTARTVTGTPRIWRECEIGMLC